MIRNKLLELLAEKRFKEIHSLLKEYNPVDLAELLEELDETELAMVFRMIEKECAAEVFSYMDDDQRQALVGAFTSYVVKNKKLMGIVTAKELMTNAEETKIEKLMMDNFVSIHTTDDREDAAKLFRKYGLIAIPVIDGEERMVGIVTFDDAIDVLTEETTEDMQKMAAMTSNDESYLKTSVFCHAKHRIPWLLILMISASITGAIITRYENAFAVVPLLVSFIPMLMDTGGNCGSQSSTLIIRGLAVDELHFTDFFAIVWKEFRVALVVGVALSIANAIRIMLIYRDIGLAVVVGVSLVATILVAKLIGCMLPVFARKVHLDPAIMAAPLITTVVDTCSVIIFFKIATRVFHLS